MTFTTFHRNGRTYRVTPGGRGEMLIHRGLQEFWRLMINGRLLRELVAEAQKGVRA